MNVLIINKLLLLDISKAIDEKRVFKFTKTTTNTSLDIPYR